MMADEVPQVGAPVEDSRPKLGWLFIPAESFLLLMMVCGLLWKIVPRFAEVYRQVKVQIPTMTKMLIDLSELVCRYPWVAGILLFLIPLSLIRLSARGSKIARTLLPVIGVCFVIWLVVGLFLPLIGTLEGVGPRHHS